MSFAASPIQFTMVLATALVAGLVGLLVIVRRGPWMTTLMFASCFFAMAAFEAGTLGILGASTPASAKSWAIYLARSSALASWLWLALSVVLARTDPWQQIRNAAAYLTLALLGCLGMSVIASSSRIVREVVGHGGDGVVVLGAMGKIYLMYLVVVMVAVLMNLERMLRTAQLSARRRLRPMFLAFLVAIFSQLMVVSTGLLYGEIRVSWLAISSAPVFVSAIAAALALGRRRLLDVSIPADRPVFQYSSVSLTLAGIFLLSMAVLSKLLPILTPEWKRAVSWGFYLLAGGGGLLLLVSPRVNREVRRFIDRSLYASRYDYRREWERVSAALMPVSLSLEEVCRQVEGLLRAAFDADRVAVYLRDEPGGGLRRIHGLESMPEMIEADNPLVHEFERSRAPLVLRDVARDLDLIPVAVENRAAIQALTAAVCAPLAVGDQLVGLLWLSERRSREEYAFEDVEFLGTMSRQVANLLWLAREAEQIADRRQQESIRRLSSHVLEGLRERIADLTHAVQTGQRDPAEALAEVRRVLGGMDQLVGTVSWITGARDLRPEAGTVREVIDQALRAAGLVEGTQGGVSVKLHCAAPEPVVMDRRLMARALSALLSNAREAIEGRGEIEVHAQAEQVPGVQGPSLALTIHDTGPGIAPEFIRAGLFRPFVTTKADRLGIGLAQCRAIVAAHGGTITVSSSRGGGTTFKVSLPSLAPPASGPASAPGGAPLASRAMPQAPR